MSILQNLITQPVEVELKYIFFRFLNYVMGFDARLGQNEENIKLNRKWKNHFLGQIGRYLLVGRIKVVIKEISQLKL